MKAVVLRVWLSLSLGAGALQGGEGGGVRPDPQRFAREVGRIAMKRPVLGEIVFTGSSSIRKWKTLGEDFAGLPVHNHGFGGSIANDVREFAEELIGRHEPRVVVLYTGSNDLVEPLSVREAMADYRALLLTIHRRLPEARVIVNSVKVAAARAEQIPRVMELNGMLEKWAADKGWVEYVDATSYLIGEDGRIVGEYFAKDQLHLSARGYAEWRAILEPVVRREWERDQVSSKER